MHLFSFVVFHLHCLLYCIWVTWLFIGYMILCDIVVGESTVCRYLYWVRCQGQLWYFSNKSHLWTVLENSLIISIYRDAITCRDRCADCDWLSIDFVCDRGNRRCWGKRYYRCHTSLCSTSSSYCKSFHCLSNSIYCSLLDCWLFPVFECLKSELKWYPVNVISLLIEIMVYTSTFHSSWPCIFSDYEVLICLRDFILESIQISKKISSSIFSYWTDYLYCLKSFPTVIYFTIISKAFFLYLSCFPFEIFEICDSYINTIMYRKSPKRYWVCSWYYCWNRDGRKSIEDLVIKHSIL